MKTMRILMLVKAWSKMKANRITRKKFIKRM